MSVHSHQRPLSSSRRGLKAALLLTASMMAIEFAVGLASGSLSLLADAGHMLADASALALSLLAAWIAAQPATSGKTYGYSRMEILAALFNGMILWLIVIAIYWQALHRLRHPLAVASGPMMIAAAAGLLVNLLSAWLLRKERSSNLNIQGAWLNVMSDALGSVGVLFAGALIHVRGWLPADPLASMLIGILIAVNSLKLVGQSVNILLEATPRHLALPEVMAVMRSVPGVRDVHDVHLWTITSGLDAMSGHVVVGDLGQSAQILSALNAAVSQRFGITHTTFQLEPEGSAVAG